MYITNETIKNIIDAVEKRRPVLLDRVGSIEKSFYLRKILSTFNQLIIENNRFSAEGKGYLEQIEVTLARLREAVVIVDRRQLIQLTNQAFRSMVDISESPIDHRLDQYIHGADFLEFLKDIKGGVTSHRREIEATIGDRKVWLELSAAEISPHQKTPMTLFVLHDISRQKQLEEMRTEFIANVSHELKTPVTIIKGFSEALLDDEGMEIDQQRRFIGKIHSNSVRLNTLIQDLLLISRLECTGIELEKEPICLNELIREVGENFESRIDKENQKIHYDFDQEQCEVQADSLRLSQVLTNLSDNVLSHAKGFTELIYRTKIDGDRVWCSVVDNGPGIPEKDLPHIFERFYRVEKGRSREKGGTGLGMSIVKHIIQSHGGNLRAESTLGKGTTISFWIPRMPESS